MRACVSACARDYFEQESGMPDFGFKHGLSYVSGRPGQRQSSAIKRCVVLRRISHCLNIVSRMIKHC